MRFDRLYLRGIVKSIEKRISLTRLDLSGLTVLTEAATGGYSVTPVIAAMAGAELVIAYTKDSPYGSIQNVINETKRLIDATGMSLNIKITNTISLHDYSKADIVTNSGHLRPITREHIMSMKPTAVIPLMYESWELRREDVDLEACREQGIRVAGINEHHKMLDVFSFLGPLVGSVLYNAFIPMMESRIAVVSNNAFGSSIARYLVSNRAKVFCVGPEQVFKGVGNAVLCGDIKETIIREDIDASIIATTPSVITTNTYPKEDLTKFILNLSPHTCIHLWGDVDYKNLCNSDIIVIPENPIKEGHQGLSMSLIGPEPIIRLQTGGLKVGEILIRGSNDPFSLELCQIVV